MWTKGALLLLAGKAVANDITPEVYERAFADFVTRFDRTYADEVERIERFNKFKATYKFITESNAENNLYTLEVNSFSDQSTEEFSQTHFGFKSSELKGAWGVPHLGTHVYSGSPLADSVDWNAKGAVTPAKNQGQCGSCWSFSTTGSLEGAWQIATGNLVSLSEEQLVQCSKENNACGGGSMDAAFGFGEKNGACTEESYPYTSGSGTVGTCQQSSCTMGIPVGGITGFKDVAHSDQQAMMEAVSLGPVSIAIEADKAVFQSYKTGVMNGQCGSKLDHGILCVGYGADQGTKYWLVKNSWGEVWGQKGFGKLLRGKGESGECGILADASYPVVNGKAPPGPAPAPTPPSPPAPPAPTSGHYGPPPCAADEEAVRVQGISGVLCSPKCDGNSCPQDVPAGTTATPACALKTPTGDGYCALECQGGGCPPGATCQSAGAAGICTYPSDSTIASKMFASANTVEVTV